MTPLERIALSHGKTLQDWHRQLEKRLLWNPIFYIFMRGQLRDAYLTGETVGVKYLEFDEPELVEAAERFMPAVRAALGYDVRIATAQVSRETIRERKEAFKAQVNAAKKIRRELEAVA